MKNKQVLIRKCIACNNRKLKKFLIRVCRTNNDTVEIDTSFKKEGRGAYICNESKQCIENAIKFNKLSRALRTNIPVEIVEKLQKKIEEIQNINI